MLLLLLVTAGALATARLTRLLTADYLTQPLRRRVLQAVQEGGRTEYLLSCRWCASVWIGVLVAALVVGQAAALDAGVLRLGFFGTAGLVLLLGLAYSQVTGQLATREVEV